MPATKVFVTDTLPAPAKEALQGCEVFEGEASDDVLSQCEVLIAWPSRARGELLKKMKGLKALQSMAAGVDGFELSSLPSGVRVFSNAGAFTVPVAEHAWGILLGVAKGVHIRNSQTIPRMLRGKALLVVGCGSIGTEVARLSRSLNMRTIGASRSFKDPSAFDERHPMSELKEAIGKADAVVIALPLTSNTKGVVDYATLAAAKEHVVVANVGRGETVDEEGLVKWLSERPESRYATDVFWKREGREVFDTAAWQLPNFAGTLHRSGVPLGNDLSVPKVAAAKNVGRYLATGKAENEVDVREYGASDGRPS